MDNSKAAMSSYKAQVEQYGKPISDWKFKELREYANGHGIRLSGFKDFVGDIDVIKIVIDDICEIAEDFPAILDERNGIELELDYNMGTDFATTMAGHIIHLNAVFFSNLKMMEEEYGEGVNSGRFVSGTDWRAISRHEVGHVVASIYHIDSLKLAMDVLNTKNKADVYGFLYHELSIYSVEYADGREIISESFSAYYSDVRKAFVDGFIKISSKTAEIICTPLKSRKWVIANL